MVTRYKLLAAVLVLVSAVLAVPAPAWAHTELLATSPADAAVVTSPLDEVTLTFSGPVRADGSSVTVTGPDGQSHSDGAVSVIDFVVHQPVTDLASGTYQVQWQVAAGDGHPMSGQFTFELSLPAEPSPTPSPSTPNPDPTSEPTPSPGETGETGPGGWVWAVALLAVLAVIALVVALVLRRSRRP
jgi:methionine-rich copper-binding protein CopC